MTYEQAKALLEEKGQAHLLKYYDELSCESKEKLLNAIAQLNWSFEEDLKHPADLTGKDRDIRPIKGLH